MFASPKPVPQLSNQQMRTLQSFLVSMGYSPGAIDGIWGPKTRAAWMAFTAANGWDQTNMTADGWGYVTGAADTGSLVKGDGTEPPATSGAGDGTLDAAEIEQIKQKYPTLAHLLDHEEVGPLITQAVKENWAPDQLMLRMEATTWWQTTTASQRQFDAAWQRDPATIQADIARQQVVLSNLFGAYGIPIQPDALADMAYDVVRNGVSETEVLRLVGNRARALGQQSDTGAFGGSFEGNLGGLVQDLFTAARQYHLGYSEGQLEEWAVRIMEGQWSIDAAHATMRKQAAQAYPALRDQIEQGMTVEDFFAPTKNKLAQLLELNPNQIDLTHERWSDVTQLVDSDMGPRPMTFAELGVWARQQEEWWDTSEAQGRMYSGMNQLLKTMGAI